MKAYNLGGITGLVEQRKNRHTKTTIQLFHSLQGGIERDPETPWTVVCADHGYLSCFSSLKLARDHMAFPEWCEDCQPMLFPKDETGPIVL